MGADLLSCMLVIKKDTLPDWDAAHAAVDKMTVEELDVALQHRGWTDDEETEEDGPLATKEMHAIIDRVRDSLSGARNVTSYLLLGHCIWLTAEMSWGDCSDTLSDWTAFTDSPCYKAAGFCFPTEGQGTSLQEGDYVLEGESCWITAKSMSVRLKKTDEGVVVDIYPLGRETDDAIASTYAFDSEADDEPGT